MPSVYLEYPLKECASKKTIELNQDIILDFDAEGMLIGVEVLHASKVLNKKVLMEAQAS